MMKTIYISLALVFILIAGSFFYMKNKQRQNIPIQIFSFEDCLKAGNPVIAGSPKQCKTDDGRTYAEEIKDTSKLITYDNSSADLILVKLPYPGAVTGKEFSVIGKARGNWYFEASFPVEVLDKDGKRLFVGHAQAEGEWMTEEFVPFKSDVKVHENYMGPATLVLHKDNPSGEAKFDASISFPIVIEY